MPDVNNPSDGDSSKGSEKLPEAAEQIMLISEGEMVMDEDNKDISLSTEGSGQVLRGVGSMISGTDVMCSILKDAFAVEGVRENPLTLPAIIKSSESDGEGEEDTEDTLAQLSLSDEEDSEPYMKEFSGMNIYQLLEREDSKARIDEALIPETPPVDIRLVETSPCETTSPSKTGPSIDVMNLPVPDDVAPEDFDKFERRVLSEFEKDCRRKKEIYDKRASNLMAEAEESYLTLSNEKVKRLEILNPNYNLISKDYEPKVGIFGKSYQIIIDVSSFDPENIVVHVVSDAVNVYARAECKGADGSEFVELHKVYKIPQIVKKDEFKAHMLNPLKLLCICAPIELPQQE